MKADRRSASSANALDTHLASGGDMGKAPETEEVLVQDDVSLAPLVAKASFETLLPDLAVVEEEQGVSAPAVERWPYPRFDACFLLRFADLLAGAAQGFRVSGGVAQEPGVQGLALRLAELVEAPPRTRRGSSACGYPENPPSRRQSGRQRPGRGKRRE